MKIAIIGAGHIGSAIVTCLAQGHLYNEKDIIVSNPNIDKLERLQEHFPAIHITTDNQQAISEAEVIVLAINPWKVDEVLSPLRFAYTNPRISCVRSMYLPPGSFNRSRDAYLSGSSQYGHYRTFQPHFDSFPRNR